MKPDIERKKKYGAPLHKKRKQLNVHLSKKVKEKNNTMEQRSVGPLNKVQLGSKKRSMLVKKGDTVKVMRGKHKGKESKVAKVDHKNTKVYLEGISVRTARGREMPAAFQPSNLEITALVERKGKKSR